jgi:large subunit ribosomal protein L4
LKIDLYEQSGNKKGEIEVSDKMFSAEVNDELIRMALVRQQANARLGLAHVKTRAEVRGGGKKPWKQKGTGRARFGSTRNPVWRGGGIAHGPRNVRNFSVNMTKKARRGAIFCCLSQKAAESSIFALDKYNVKTPKTKDFATLMSKLPVTRSLLIVLPEHDLNLEKASKNIPNVKTILVNYLNPFDLLKFEKVMFLEPAIKKAEEIFLNS